MMDGETLFWLVFLAIWIPAVLYLSRDLQFNPYGEDDE